MPTLSAVPPPRECATTKQFCRLRCPTALSTSFAMSSQSRDAPAVTEISSVPLASWDLGEHWTSAALPHPLGEELTSHGPGGQLRTPEMSL